MCNEVERIRHLIPQWQGKSVQELFSNLYVEPKFQYYKVLPLHCLVCKRSLAEYEMWPSGRCPRSMCAVCYQRDIVLAINERCIISGNLLPKYKIEAQFLSNLEVENNIADGLARDYYTLLSCKVVGIDTSFVRDDTHTLPTISSEHFQVNLGAIGANYKVDSQLPPNYANNLSVSSARLLENTSKKNAPIGRKIKFIPKINKIW